MADRIPVAVIAATGSVGQRFVQLLDGHPWFEVVALTGSEGRVGQTYGETCHWVLTDPMPEWAREMSVVPSTPEAVNVPIVFSALPSKYATEIEANFARAGVGVFTNAGAYRRDPTVPILVPEVNADQIALIPIQRKEKGWPGLIITNPNCTSMGMTVALKVLDDVFGVQRAFAVSMQAISGAGYPGVASLDILDNVIPFIAGEEEKVEWEPRKMIGKVVDGQLKLADFQLSVHTNRVAVSDGHTVCLSVEFEREPDPREAVEVLSQYQAPECARDLPSTPEPVVFVHPDRDRPQPRLDRLTGRGMTTVVGRIRPDPLFHLKMVVLSHNTIRGAAGGSIYNAELMVNEGLVTK
ncbi:MAG TPA: aspartate-semialdehyde dehydrogenase [Anaerolineales bacterium]|nr:aspartate-semialdehyde dehydrogenase [Anaerolineales bacterium]